MATDGEIDLSYIPIAKMLANCFSKPLPKPTIQMQSAAMGMIVIGIRNALGNGLGMRRNGRRNGIRTGNGIGNPVGN
jgi:hypothetical protein